jgi:hypothetical protein
MQLNLRIQAYFIKCCLERLCIIVPKLRHSSKTVCHNRGLKLLSYVQKQAHELCLKHHHAKEAESIFTGKYTPSVRPMAWWHDRLLPVSIKVTSPAAH